MKALLFRPKPNPDGARGEGLPLLPHLNLEEITAPSIPGPEWLVVKSQLTGICGSDLGMLQGKTLPAAEPYASFPFVPGHELFGRVETMGEGVTGFAPGQRVAVDPTLACAERGFADLCRGCASEHPSRCERFAEGSLSPATIIGTCRDTGGGWGEFYVARAGRVFAVPDEISDDAALLIEPFSVCLRAVLEHPLDPGDLALVVGAGTIGLMSVAALRAAQPKCRIACVAKYPFQAECARAMGADAVVDAQQEDLIERVAELTGTPTRKLYSGGFLAAGGADLVIDSIASGDTLTQSLRAIRAGGALLIVALPSFPQDVDWSPIVFKEIRVAGSFLYGNESFEGVRQPTFARTIELLRSGRVDLAAIAPRRFAIADYASALAAAADKQSSAVKIAFEF